MTARFLLPCSCGENIPVERRQAGQAVQCACGHWATVPTLLEMARLQPLEPVRVGPAASPVAASSWGLSQRLLVLGVVVVLAAAVGAAYVAIYLRPTPPIFGPNSEDMHAWVRSLPAVGTLQFWRMAKQIGLGRGLLNVEEKYEQARTRYYTWWAILLAVGAAGAGLIAAGVLLRRARSRR